MAALVRLRAMGADVLIVRKGPDLMLTVPYGIKNMEGSPQDAGQGEMKGLREQMVLIRARLDDDSILEVAFDELHPG